MFASAGLIARSRGHRIVALLEVALLGTLTWFLYRAGVRN